MFAYFSLWTHLFCLIDHDCKPDCVRAAKQETTGQLLLLLIIIIFPCCLYLFRLSLQKKRGNLNISDTYCDVFRQSRQRSECIFQMHFTWWCFLMTVLSRKWIKLQQSKLAWCWQHHLHINFLGLLVLLFFLVWFKYPTQIVHAAAGFCRPPSHHLSIFSDTLSLACHPDAQGRLWRQAEEAPGFKVIIM